jgi:predicted acetyltransferase
MSRQPVPTSDIQDGEFKLRLHKVHSAADSPWGVPSYAFRMVMADREIGHLNLRISRRWRFTHHAGQVGYSVAAEFRGRGLAGRALEMIGPLARANGLTTLWITCNTDNAASMRVLEKAGAVDHGVVKLPRCYRAIAGVAEKRRYQLDL